METQGPRFVGYVRVSTQGQEVSGLGLEAQEAAIRRYVEQAGGVLLAEYREAESGKRSDRPILREGLSACKTMGATLLIAKLDRLARKVHFISGLMESGVDFVACDMPTKDRFMLHVQAAVAEEEGRRISVRTKEGLGSRKARGLPLGENTHRESWTPLKAIARWKNAQKATEVRMGRRKTQRDVIGNRAVELRKAFKTLQEIASALNAEGHRTERGQLWDKHSVSKLLKRSGFRMDAHAGQAAADRFRAMVMPRILALVDEGFSLEKIAERLNTDGVKGRLGGVWDKKDVQILLNREGQKTHQGNLVLRERRHATDPLLRELRERGGLPLQKIAEYLNECGILNPAGRPWNYQTVGNHLRDMGIETDDPTAERVYRNFLLDQGERERIKQRYQELSGRINP